MPTTMPSRSINDTEEASAVEEYHPSVLSSSAGSLSIPTASRIRRRSSRRGSILDYGGADSLNNFASSLRRSVNYISLSAEGNNVFGEQSPQSSPVTSRQPSVTYLSITGTTTGDLEEQPIIYNKYNREPSSAPITEESPLLAQGGIIKEDELVLTDEDQRQIIISLKSTPVQTVFNAINTLIGLGILSIPLGLHCGGWVFGIIGFTLGALATRYTALLLGKIQAKNPSLRSYQEIGIAAFGSRGGFLIFGIFGIDLFGASVIMVLLFGDSFSAIFQEVNPVYFKGFICSVLLFLNFMPLRLLSFLSLMGIICTTFTFGVILISGLTKEASPGSLLFPMPTNLWPKSFMDLLFSLGLFLAPWGGHAAFPEIYTDQKRPEVYKDCINTAFGFSYVIDLFTGIIGFLMFGSLIDAEVTKNILTTSGYPDWISSTIILLMGLLPLSKLPLACRPIASALDGFFSAHDSFIKKLGNRVLISSTIFVTSILVTSFGKVMSFLGAAICFTVCITFPIIFYIHINENELSYRDNAVLYSAVFVSVLCSLLGSFAVIVK